MEFEMTYTSEQESFRSEVRAWLEEHLPPGLDADPDDPDEAHQLYLRRREFGRILGEKGWLYPGAPVEYGGAGLDFASVIVLTEEARRLHLSLPPYYDSGGMLGSATILVWGTEEQKERFLRPIFRGEVRTWQLLTEPEAGSDLASVKLAARRDGDSYVLNGQKIFVGSAHGADRLWMIACTDRDAPRHQNLSWFMVDAHLPGITIQPLPVLGDVAEGHKNTIFFDDVRVPADCLVGGENNGWKVAGTHLELEHGAIGGLDRDSMWKRVLDYCRTEQRGGKPLIEDPDVRDGLAEIYIRLETLRLLTVRNFWQACSKQKQGFAGPQVTYLRKTTGLWMTTMVLDLLGPAALTNDANWGALDGHAERKHRDGITGLMPGGTIDVQRVIIARALGVGGRKPQREGA
jgi:alkylation response protein AidB-like acyl-CoA dehydrogenase